LKDLDNSKKQIAGVDLNLRLPCRNIHFGRNRSAGYEPAGITLPIKYLASPPR